MDTQLTVSPPTVAAMLKEALERRRMTMAAASRHLRVTRPTLSAWLGGLYTPSPERVHDLAAFVGYDPATVLTAILRDGYGLAADVEDVSAIPGYLQPPDIPEAA